MDARPVEHSRSPAYPTRREVLAGAATFALAGLTECSFCSAEAEGERVSVAPIFEHGEGRGATGCVVISPPVFLSEEEALQIVKEELAKHGVKLAAGPVLKNLKIAPRRTQRIEDDEKSQKIVVDEKHAAPLRVTGLDEKKSIAVQFVCRKNYETLGGVDPHNGVMVDREGHEWRMMSSVRHYDLKDAAQHVAAEIRQKAQQHLFVGVFYDPVAPDPATRAKWAPILKALESAEEPQHTQRSGGDTVPPDSKELLRQQAQDFAAWLKKQKAL